MGFSLNPIDYIGQALYTGTGGILGYDADLNSDISYQGGARSPIGPTYAGVGAQPSNGNGNGQTGNSTINGNTPDQNNSTTITPNYSQINANALAQLGQSAGVLNNALGRLDNQLGIARGNINTQADTRNNELTSAFNQNKNSYDTSTTQNSQNYRTNKNVINDQASQGLRGLQRLLGSYGAVGSDLGLAGQAVADVASAQNAGAGQTFSQNQSNLDTNWGNYKLADDQERKKVADWRTQQLNNAEASSNTTRQDLLSKLADIRGQEAQARGGSYAGGAQPYLDQSNALSARIDELGRLNPTYTGNTPTYTAAPLSSYQTGNGAVTKLSNTVANGLNTPYLNALLGRDKKNQVSY